MKLLYHVLVLSKIANGLPTAMCHITNHLMRNDSFNLELLFTSALFRQGCNQYSISVLGGKASASSIE